MSPHDTDAGLIELAAVVRAHGLRGELMLKPFNPASELWDDLEFVELKLADGTQQKKRVLAVHEHSGSILLTLEGVSDRNTADLFRGSLVCVPRSVLPELEEGEYYYTDLVGLSVRDIAGNSLGTVREVLEYPTAHHLVIEFASGVLEVPDLQRYVPEVNVSGGYVVVDNVAELEPEKPAGKR